MVLFGMMQHQRICGGINSIGKVSYLHEGGKGLGRFLPGFDIVCQRAVKFWDVSRYSCDVNTLQVSQPNEKMHTRGSASFKFDPERFCAWYAFDPLKHVL